MHSNRMSAFVLGLSLLGAPAILIAQGAPTTATPGTDLPSKDRLLADIVKAVGGREAVDRIKSLRTVVKLDMMGTQMEIDSSWAREGGRLMNTKTPMGNMKMGSDGKTAWMTNPMTGAFMLITDEGQKQQLDGQSGMQMMMIDPERFEKEDLDSFEVVSRESFNSVDCIKCKYVDETDKKEGFMFIDAKTNLPVGFEQTADSPRGPMKSTVLLSDWKEVSGVKFFHVMKMSAPGQMSGGMQGTFTVVEVNKLEADAFKLPPEVEALAAQKGDAGGGGAAEIKLSDLTPEQQAEATKQLDAFRTLPNAEALKSARQTMERIIPMMPEDKKKPIQYVVQELTKMIAEKGG